jgi:hypothetical protein
MCRIVLRRVFRDFSASRRASSRARRAEWTIVHARVDAGRRASQPVDAPAPPYSRGRAFPS